MCQTQTLSFPSLNLQTLKLPYLSVISYKWITTNKKNRRMLYIIKNKKNLKADDDLLEDEIKEEDEL
jgi:hypothetical protein